MGANLAAPQRHVECGGLPPLSAVPARRDVLHSWSDRGRPGTHVR
jgi:hypothetical protein